MNIIVKDNGVVVSKDVYSGDEDSIREKLDILKRENPTLEYTEADVDSFSAAEVADVKTPDQNSWGDLGTVDEKISFIAKKLGLE